MACIIQFADKFNKGKPKMSLVPEQLMHRISSTVLDDGVRCAIRCLSTAAHGTTEDVYRKALVFAYEQLRHSFATQSMQPEHAIAAACAAAMEFGIQKYSRNNWKLGFKWSEMIDAALRHLLKYPEPDEETGLDHRGHALFCLGVLLYMLENNIGENDLYEQDTETV